jgi:hypothetical protein
VSKSEKAKSMTFRYLIGFSLSQLPLHRSDYFKLGTVTEFRFSQEISRAFSGGDQLKWLQTFGEGWGFFESKFSLTFVDNQ